MYFLNNLDVLMRERKLTRSEFAREVGIAPSTINSWYSKGYDNVSLRFLIKISKFFNITIDELIHSQMNKEDADMEMIRKFYEFYKQNQAK